MLKVPTAFAARLRPYDITVETMGCSGATVARLESTKHRPLYLKSEPAGPFAGLPAEAETLRWLRAPGVPSPEVLSYLEETGRLWLLTTALPGRNLASSPDLHAAEIVKISAEALRDLHGRDAFNCPFVCRVEARLTLARARMMAGLVLECDFDEERLGRTATELFDELLAMRPHEEDLVLTHGDACLPNLIADDARFTGFVDCARTAVADRCQDLALAARSISSNLGAEWGDAFLTAYGGSADRDRLSFYRLLDEFF